MSTYGFPVEVKDPATGASVTPATEETLARLAGYKGLYDLLNREGEPIAIRARSAMSLANIMQVAGAGFSGPAPLGPNIGRAVWIEDVTYGSSKPLEGRYQVGTTGSAWPGTGTFPSSDQAFTCGPGDSFTLPGKGYIRSCDRISSGAAISNLLDMEAGAPLGTFTADTTSGSAIITNVNKPLATGFTVVGAGIQTDTVITAINMTTVTLSKPATATATGVSCTQHGVSISCSYRSWQLADSINFDADHVNLIIGDSTFNGTGPTDVRTCIPFQINRQYQEAGIDSRFILKAQSGSTTAGHYWNIYNGKYRFPRVSAIHINLGINDAAQSYTTDTGAAGGTSSMPNIREMYRMLRACYPGVPIVFYGATPVQNNTFEATLASLRSAISTFVDNTDDPLLAYFNLGNLFDRAVGSNYVASDGVDGTRIHGADPALTQTLDGGYNGITVGLRKWLTDTFIPLSL